MLMARLGTTCTISCAHRSRRSESSGAVALNSSTSRPRTAAASGLNASAGASTMKKWMSRVHRLLHGRRDLVGRLHRDPLEREIGLEHARQRLRLVDADLRAGEGVLAGLEDQALVGPDRLVAGIALDLDEADRQPLPRRLRILGAAPARPQTRASRQRPVNSRTGCQRLLIDDHAPGHAADRNRDHRLAALRVDDRDVVAEAVGDVKQLPRPATA